MPLSFRPREPENQFIRPSLAGHLVALADAAYAVFYHVAHVHAYDQRLLFRKDLHDFPRPTECLYCFFAHVHSAHEALLHFCDAVNRVRAHYDADAVFDLEYDPVRGRHPFGLKGSAAGLADCEPVDGAASQRMQSTLAAYRNLLIHEKPIFLQNMWLPRTSELEAYSGLTAIGRVVKDPDCLRRDFRPVGEVRWRR